MLFILLKEKTRSFLAAKSFEVLNSLLMMEMLTNNYHKVTVLILPLPSLLAWLINSSHLSELYIWKLLFIYGLWRYLKGVSGHAVWYIVMEILQLRACLMLIGLIL
jgi:hypothetical protein